MYLLLLVHIFQSFLLAIRSCPALCVCSYGNSGTAQLRLVQCSDFGILVVPINVPADTVKLRLEKTLISRLPRAAFYNLSELQFLWLVYNSITSIHPSSFVNLKSLRELRLDGNLLTSFPWEGLRDTPQLQTLGLHNNRLSSLPAHAALFLLNITCLDLSSNRLAMLPAELLDLWLPLPGQQQEGQVKRRILGVHDNPWLCDCQIFTLISLSMSLGSPIVLMDQLLMCSESKGQSAMLLTKAELSRCMRPSVQPATTSVISTLGSNVILRCDARGYPTPTLTWIKTSSYTDCCQQHLLENSEQLPRKLDSYMQVSRVGDCWSIISLNGLSYKDAGEYRCQARNGAGTSEALIKLKVVGVTRLSRLPKKKSQKTKLKSLFKYRNLNPNPAPVSTPIGKKKEMLQNVTPPSFNKTQTVLHVVSKGLPIDETIK
ncbi:leucine-rich repeat, immunoglobulin-like domain and transmembrane domain-containing protein 3b [Solea solea]|uniref:leucine-rich repeat, immunoglobulin-like domain and transmembrane domain-containing protein 3b n=1 Tax=Solea solea TaxID=90069 RepID=UPI00272CAE87|nr:leucine-rich repeat, immunoglobulin-like domain and transmembrane domain-containing protein 3b [Solea solea]